MRRSGRVGLLLAGTLFRRLQRCTSGRDRRRVLFLALTMGVVSGHQSRIEVLTRGLEDLDGVSLCEVAFTMLRFQLLAPNHFLRERGLERRLLLGSLFRR